MPCGPYRTHGHVHLTHLYIYIYIYIYSETLLHSAVRGVRPSFSLSPDIKTKRKLKNLIARHRTAARLDRHGKAVGGEEPPFRTCAKSRSSVMMDEGAGRTRGWLSPLPQANGQATLGRPLHPIHPSKSKISLTRARTHTLPLTHAHAHTHTHGNTHCSLLLLLPPPLRGERKRDRQKRLLALPPSLLGWRKRRRRRATKPSDRRGRVSLNRRKRGACSNRYNTPADMSVVCRRFGTAHRTWFALYRGSWCPKGGPPSSSGAAAHRPPCEGAVWRAVDWASTPFDRQKQPRDFPLHGHSPPPLALAGFASKLFSLVNSPIRCAARDHVA